MLIILHKGAARKRIKKILPSTTIVCDDNTIHDEDYILNTYNYPILAKIPDLLETPTKRYGYYQRYYYKKK